jgi:hypothetical protein
VSRNCDIRVTTAGDLANSRHIEEAEGLAREISSLPPDDRVWILWKVIHDLLPERRFRVLHDLILLLIQSHRNLSQIADSWSYKDDE